MSSISFEITFRSLIRQAAILLLAAVAQSSAAENAPVRGPEPARQTILVLGDSLAAGLGVDPGEAFPALLQRKIDEQGWNFKVVNAGVSGDTSAGGLRRIEWLLRQKVSVLILELGANDGLRGIAPRVTRTNLQAIIDRVRNKHPDLQVIIAGMKLPPNLGAEYVQEFEEIFPELAKQNGARLIPFLLEGVGGTAEFNQSDRIHPNPAGHRIVAENAWKVLRPALKELGTTE